MNEKYDDIFSKNWFNVWTRWWERNTCTYTSNERQSSLCNKYFRWWKKLSLVQWIGTVNFKANNFRCQNFISIRMNKREKDRKKEKNRQKMKRHCHRKKSNENGLQNIFTTNFPRELPKTYSLIGRKTSKICTDYDVSVILKFKWNCMRWPTFRNQELRHELTRGLMKRSTVCLYPVCKLNIVF